jgi:exopolysaccharide biosynthesis polyprenyl glycosylphosphotransferase
MPVKTVRFYTFALIALDCLAILGAFVVAYILRTRFDSRAFTPVYAHDYLVTFSALLPIWMITLSSLGLYSPNVYIKRLTEIGKLFIASFIGILLMIGYGYMTGTTLAPARVVLAYAFVLTFVFLVTGREFLRIIRNLMYRFELGVQRVMIIGSSITTYDMAVQLANTRESGYKVVAIVANKRSSKGMRMISSLTEAMRQLTSLKIDTIIQTELFEDSNKNQLIMQATQNHHIQYCFVPGEAEFYSGRNRVDVFLGYPIIKVYQTPLIGWGEFAKRVFDLFVVILLAPAWLPLLLLTIAAQKILNSGPVFYKSPRLTVKSKQFSLIKFRSMGAHFGSKDAASEFLEMGRPDLAKEYKKNRKVVNDPRITRFGKFLRATSLDELPQLLNVLTGDLSLVGPRPILPQEIDLYRGRGSLLHSVRSGITGLWQVSGRSNLPFDKRVELELYYAQNWSFWLDVKILFKTIGVVLFQRGAK